MDIPILAGALSTVVFAASNLPMLGKALRTRDVSSYSLSSLVMINGANLVYSLYVFTLPIGPVWALHAFYVVSCAIMLLLCLREHERRTTVEITPVARQDSSAKERAAVVPSAAEGPVEAGDAITNTIS